MDHFVLHSEYQPTGDQPQAIEELVKGFQINQLWYLPTIKHWRPSFTAR